MTYADHNVEISGLLENNCFYRVYLKTSCVIWIQKKYVLEDKPTNGI